MEWLVEEDWAAATVAARVVAMEGLAGLAAVERVGGLAAPRAAVVATGGPAVGKEAFVAKAVRMVAKAGTVGSALVAGEAPVGRVVSVAT